MDTRFLIIFIGVIMSISVIATNNFENHAYASCAAPLFGPSGPCFDSFNRIDLPWTERTIMESLAKNIELNYGDWEMSDRKWDDEDTPLQLPAIICTEFVVDGTKQYRMAKWVDSHKVSSFEDYRDDSLCDKWLPPIDDGVKIRWDRPNYAPNDTAFVRVIDSVMNQDGKKIDTFDIHVWSDIDHKGVKLSVTETGNNTGIFQGTIFFTTKGESGGIILLVEDAVYAEHKQSVNMARIFENPQRINGRNISPDNTIYPVPWEDRPPLKQFKSGIPIDQIQCKEGFVVAIKNTNGKPNCVKRESLEILRERGWAEALGDIVFQRTVNSEHAPTVIIPKGSASADHQSPLIPKEIIVVLGKNNTVTWINQDDIPSTLVSDFPGWTTGIIMPGKSASVTFNQTGEYSYHGMPHPWKTGIVIVLEK